GSRPHRPPVHSIHALDRSARGRAERATSVASRLSDGAMDRSIRVGPGGAFALHLIWQRRTLSRDRHDQDSVAFDGLLGPVAEMDGSVVEDFAMCELEPGRTHTAGKESLAASESRGNTKRCSSSTRPSASSARTRVPLPLT